MAAVKMKYSSATLEVRSEASCRAAHDPARWAGPPANAATAAGVIAGTVRLPDGQIQQLINVDGNALLNVNTRTRTMSNNQLILTNNVQ